MRIRGNDKGVALVMVLMVTAMFLVLALALLFQGSSERIVAVNEQDHLKTLAYAEAGLAWAQRRVFDRVSGDYTSLLLGPDPRDARDDQLLGLRDLSLGDPAQFTAANEATVSAIVLRDFDGEGPAAYEAIRLEDGPATRALVYVRIDDNFDDAVMDPDEDDPLTDTDRRLRVTAVAEYPIFVDGAGVAVENSAARGRARRIVTATLAGAGEAPALAVGGDLILTGGMTACGACGSVHTNGSMTIDSSPEICQDATAHRDWNASGRPRVGGSSGGGYPSRKLPSINPYDKLYVPTPEVFDTAELPLPRELECGILTPADPGNAKYFALVADSAKGKVFKAYWDFTNLRWRWKQVDDLSDGADTKLDDCGRAPGDAFYGAAVDDGEKAEFYGFRASAADSAACRGCGTPGGESSLCSLARNDFGFNGYYDAATGAAVGSIPGSAVPALPGGFPGDGLLDYQPTSRVRGGTWTYGTDTIYSPLYNAVLFFYGNVKIAKDPGSPGEPYCHAADCGSVPAAFWMVSLVADGDIVITGSPEFGPANAAQGYAFQLVAGRDIKISGDPGQAHAACARACAAARPSSLELRAGITAAHEQLEITGRPSLVGMVQAEGAADCSGSVDGGPGGESDLSGAFSIHYDCEHPASPWPGSGRVLSWREVE